MDLKSVVFTFLLLCCGNINTCVLGCGWCDRLWGRKRFLDIDISKDINEYFFNGEIITADVLEAYIYKMLEEKNEYCFVDGGINLYEKIPYLTMANFEKITDPYAKLLAKWFLSDEDYEKDIKSCLEQPEDTIAENTNELQEEKNTNKLKDVKELFNENSKFRQIMDNSFRESLNKNFKKNSESLNNKIKKNMDSLNDKFEEDGDSLNNKIKENVDSSNNKIKKNMESLNNKNEENGDSLNNKIEENVDSSNNKIKEKMESLNNKIKDKAAMKTELSQFLQQCKPFEGEVYRGTGFYYEDSSSKEYVKEVILEKKLDRLFSTIKGKVWHEEGVGYFSKNNAVAGYFANEGTGNTNFNIIIRCRRGINGVDVSVLQEKEDLYSNDVGSVYIKKEEEEVLFPENSSFKILGLRPEKIKYFWRASLRPKDQFFGAFIFLDVVQVKNVENINTTFI